MQNNEQDPSKTPVETNAAVVRDPGLVTLSLNTEAESQPEEGYAVEALIAVDLQAHEVFQFLRDFTHLPQFMKRVERVETLTNVRSIWHYRTRAGLAVSWENEVIAEIEDRMISWRARIGNDDEILRAGTFWVRENGARTEVNVQLRYREPHPKFAHGLGITLPELLGEDPERRLQQDLKTLKAVLESRH